MLKKLLNRFKREPDMYIGGKDDPYMKRWYLIPRNRFINIYLHEFLRDDRDEAMHDHPWHSLSFIIKGGYIEVTDLLMRIHKEGSIIFRGATHRHRIKLFPHFEYKRVSPGLLTYLQTGLKPCWTLFITGPRIREWGFHCPKGFVHWKEFVNRADSGLVGQGCGE